MQSYLFVGGVKDGLNIPAPDDCESVQLPLGVTGLETYVRSTLAVDGVSVTFYRHEDLAAEQVLARLVVYYRAWCVNRPVGRAETTKPGVASL